MLLVLNGVEIDATEEHAEKLLREGWAVKAREPEKTEKPKAAPRKRAAKQKE